MSSVGILDQAQVGQRVLDLGALEEAQPAIDAVRNGAALNSACSSTRDCAFERYSTATSDRSVALGDQALDLLDQPGRLVAIGLRLVDAHRLALTGVGPQLLAEPRARYCAISALAALRMWPTER